MMKKVSLSQLLSRSPRHQGSRRASTTNGEVVVVAGSPPHHLAHTLHDNAPKKKNKTGILQTIKKKLSGKFDTIQNSNTPKKSKSFEGLSNSFGDSFSQSISEESSSDGLNASGGQPHKGKHSKRAIRPMHTGVARQNSSSHVLTDTESEVLIKNCHGDCLKLPAPKPTDLPPSVQPQAPSLSLFGNNSHVPEAKAPIVLLENSALLGGGCGGGGGGGTLDASPTNPQFLVEGISGGGATEGPPIHPRAGSGEKITLTETSSPQPSKTFGETWDLRELNLDASKRSLAEELFRLARFGWYWGPITRAEAEEKLMEQTDGAFLVRDSSDDKYLLSLSFRSFNKTLHTRIEHSNGWFSFYPHPEHEGHTSLVGLIDHCMSHSESGVFCYSRARVRGSPSFPVRLTKPVSRFTQVRSLQYLCRFVIRQYTRVDHIQALPLPSRIKGYLEEGHY